MSEVHTQLPRDAPTLNNGQRATKHRAAKIAAIYLFFGVSWIFVTDKLLVTAGLSLQRISTLQTAKGWLFVLGSSALLYLLLRRYQERDRRALDALVASRAQVQQMNAELERRVRERTAQLEAANRELESFAYAVSHDLRAPLRSLSGFSQLLHESAPQALDDNSRHYLHRIQEACQRMSTLIDDLLGLSRISRSELTRRSADLSQIAIEAAAAIRERYPDREVSIDIAPNMQINGDTRLLRIALENLLDNAWKYTARATPARVEVGVQPGQDENIFFVRDNGVGFDMKYAQKLFVPFQRLHSDPQFPGTGIGLVTVQRIVARHGGRLWADSKPNEGTTFYFTIGSDEVDA